MRSFAANSIAELGLNLWETLFGSAEPMQTARDRPRSQRAQQVERHGDVPCGQPSPFGGGSGGLEELILHRPAAVLTRCQPGTDTFREAEDLAASHTEKLGVRSFDLMHVGLAIALGATEFLTFDLRQASLARAAGLQVKP